MNWSLKSAGWTTAATAALLLTACNGQVASSSDGGASGYAGYGGNGGSFAVSTALPCDVARVIADNCQGCHAATPLYGAPMPLVSWEDMIRAITWDNASRPDPIGSGVVVGEQIANRIHHPTSPMPPAQVANQLDNNEMAILDAWLRNPTPIQPNDTCNGNQGGVGGAAGAGAVGGSSGVGGDSGTGGVGGMSGTGGDSATGGTGGNTTNPEEPYVGIPPDCDNTYEFLAHGSNGATDTTPYNVSQATASGNKYECFHFSAPWGSQTVQGVRFEPVIGDARVLHHWILYGNTSANGTAGTIGNCGSKGVFIQGWAPGGQPTALPRNVGIQMPSGPNANFTLEVHYNNSGRYTDARDRSGVRVCTTNTPRQHTAAVHWLGTPLIFIGAGQTTTVNGTCTPAGNATIMSVSPHMHQLGTHMTTVINRAGGGGTEMLHDGAFSFDNQVAYAKSPFVVINPGDTLRTSCTYTNTTNSTVTFGENTENEMCFNFVLAYPPGSLASRSGNVCY